MSGKILVLRRKEKILSLLIKDDRLLQAQAQEEEAGSLVGKVYVGKVKKVTAAVGAAFVEISEGLLGFLPLSECRQPVLTNRLYDGRLMEGDEIVVQVGRDAQKTKQPGLTAKISLSGRYCVVCSGRPGIGISGKLNRSKGERWKELLSHHEEIACLPYGIIVRTNAGELVEEAALISEIRNLAESLDRLFSQAEHRTCFSVLYRNPPEFLTWLRDVYEDAYEEIVTDDGELCARIREYLNTESGMKGKKLRLYEDERVSLSSLYGVEAKLQEALSEKVWLRSGGYLIIQQTEALTAVDVNSGKGTAAGSALRLNLEAAEEIMRQCRLRNLSGILILDFVNMESGEDNELLMSSLRRLAREDPVKTMVVDMTPLGLVEVTRKKIHKSLSEQLRG